MKFCTMSSSEKSKAGKEIGRLEEVIESYFMVSGDEEEEKWGTDVNLKFWVKLLVHSYQDQQEFSFIQTQLQRC